MLRGRNDRLSSNYTKVYLQVLQLDKRMTRERIKENREILKEILDSINEQRKNSRSMKRLISSEQLAKKFGVNTDNKYWLNPRDIEMIHGLLGYQNDLFESGKNNMFDYLVALICENNIIKAYKDLIRVPYVGDKLAAFTLRDCVFLSKKCHHIKPKPYDYLMLFPVDTWVEQGGKKLLDIDAKVNVNLVLLKIELINLCEKYGTLERDPLAPLKLNAGIWYQLTQNQQ